METLIKRLSSVIKLLCHQLRQSTRSVPGPPPAAQAPWPAGGIMLEPTQAPLGLDTGLQRSCLPRVVLGLRARHRAVHESPFSPKSSLRRSVTSVHKSGSFLVRAPSKPCPSVPESGTRRQNVHCHRQLESWLSLHKSSFPSQKRMHISLGFFSDGHTEGNQPNACTGLYYLTKAADRREKRKGDKALRSKRPVQLQVGAS